MTGALGFILLAIGWMWGQPEERPWMFACGLVVAVAGLMLRIWATGWLVKNKALTVSGPYRLTRNPLYLGTLILVLGQSMMSGVPWTVLVFSPLCLALYWPTLLEEEQFLSERYGPEYARYASRVPLLFPSLKFANSLDTALESQSFSWARIRRCYKGFSANLLLILFYVFLLILH